MGGMGYPTEPVDTLSVANFFHEHTPEQIAAYDNETCGAARSDDLDALRALHRSGKTLQCSNRFGESLIHIACRRGSLPVIAFLLDEAGVSIRVRDDCGRTPLHVS
jgi:ankyrin repeat protein